MLPWQSNIIRKAKPPPQNPALTTNSEMAETILKSAVAWARVTYSRPGAMRVLERASETTACCNVPGGARMGGTVVVAWKTSLRMLHCCGFIQLQC